LHRNTIITWQRAFWALLRDNRALILFQSIPELAGTDMGPPRLMPIKKFKTPQISRE